MWSHEAHSTNLKGPVPLTAVFEFEPSMVSLSTMLKALRKSKMPGRGWSDVRVTVYLSGVSMPVNQALCGARVPASPVSFGSRTRSRLYLTSSLVNSRPLWNGTPLRRLNLNVLLSELASQLSANTGWGCSVKSYTANLS